MKYSACLGAIECLQYVNKIARYYQKALDIIYSIGYYYYKLAASRDNNKAHLVLIHHWHIKELRPDAAGRGFLFLKAFFAPMLSIRDAWPTAPKIRARHVATECRALMAIGEDWHPPAEDSARAGCIQFVNR